MRPTSVFKFLSSSLVLITSACGGTEAITGATGDPCKGEYATYCGAECQTDLDCRSGLHCEGQSCTAECSTSTPCKSGFECDSLGLCAEAEGGGTTGGSSGGSSEDSCIDIDLRFDELIPNVMLLIDRSGSMDANFPGAADRWEAVKEALIDPAAGVVKQLEKRVRFGLLLYTSDDGFAGGQCPQLIGDQIPIALDNYSAIEAAYGQAGYLSNGDTPTAESVVAARNMLLGVQNNGPKVIVLATDGEPDTCEDADAHNPTTNQRSVSTVQEAYNMGVSLAVIAVGNDVGAGHLQDLANAGAGYAVGGNEAAPTYTPSDRQGLIDAFASIVDQNRSCEVLLDHSVSDPSQGSVVLDGTALPYGDANGWELTSSTRLELKGEACSRLKQDAAGLQIRFPGCVVVPI